MAALNELIQKIENPELRAQIQAAADKLVKQKKFGLVFEEHLPECTPLYDIPVRKGLKVSLRGGKANETYTVLKIEDGTALCLPRNGNEAVEFPVDDLVTTAELGDPIYPCLQMLDDMCNAPDSDLWHTLIEADNYVPEKPPGMWRKTYHRYLARFFRYRNKHTQRLIQDLARITGKFK